MFAEPSKEGGHTRAGMICHKCKAVPEMIKDRRNLRRPQKNPFVKIKRLLLWNDRDHVNSV